MGNWDGITGQDRLVSYFRNAAESRHFSHAYILEGDAGAPKEQIAQAFARMLLCEKGTGCGVCHACHLVDTGNHPDLIRVTHEKPTEIRIDEIRHQLVEDVSIRPYSSNYKVYIVEDAELMNTAAQNALLKTLEEPPEYAVIFLIARNADGFLPTILSRAMRLAVSDPSGQAGGLDEVQRERIFGILRVAGETDRASLAKAVAEWKEAGIPAPEVINLVRLWFRDILVLKQSGEDRLLRLRGETGGIRKASERYSWTQCGDILQLADRTERRIASNVNYELSLLELFGAMRYPARSPEPVEHEEQEDLWANVPLPSEEEIAFYENSGKPEM